ncbi:MAG: rod shape-determining protein RodA [Gammaproteobacteria bacterium]
MRLDKLNRLEDYNHSFSYPKWLTRIHIDWPLLLGILVLICISLIVVYSARQQSAFVLQKQLIRSCVAILLMLAIAQIPPNFWKKVAYPIYGVALVLLLAVLVGGKISKGAQRWLDLGLFRFQPSELMKLAMPLMLAFFFENRSLPPTWKNIVQGLFWIILPVLLIAKQPDLGTAILIAASGVITIYFTGMSWKKIFGLLALVACLLPLLWFVMHEYQRERILTLVDPERDKLGSGYHIIQSKIAIGSGGISGKGWKQGTQAYLEYLPESSTDFVFAVFAEEFGLVGCIFLLLTYTLVILRGLYISVQAQDVFRRLLAGTLSMMTFVYLFVNMGMVMGILPVVGVPLPLVSYGGTSLVTLMINFGILMSIHTHRRLLA